MKAHQRPKIEVYDEDLFVVLKTARYDDEREAVEFAELQLFVGRAVRRHRAPRRGERALRGAAHHRGRPGPDPLRPDGRAPRRDRPRRRRLPAGDPGPRQRHGRDRGRRVRHGPAPRASTPASGSSSSSARCSTSTGTPSRCSSRSAGWPPASCPGAHPELGSYFRDVEDHLTRAVERASATTATCSPTCSTPTSPRSPSARTTTCARSRPGSPSAASRPWSVRSTA